MAGTSSTGSESRTRSTRYGTGPPSEISRRWPPQPLSVAVELTGLSDEEIEELASLTQELSARTAERHDNPVLRTATS